MLFSGGTKIRAEGAASCHWRQTAGISGGRADGKLCQPGSRGARVWADMPAGVWASRQLRLAASRGLKGSAGLQAALITTPPTRLAAAAPAAASACRPLQMRQG